MKNFKISLLVIVVLALQSCMSIHEKLVVNDDYSGYKEFETDLGGMLTVVNLAEGFMDSEKSNFLRDTIRNGDPRAEFDFVMGALDSDTLVAIIDTVYLLKEEQRYEWSDTRIFLKFDEVNSEGQLRMISSFSDEDQMNLLLQNSMEDKINRIQDEMASMNDLMGEMGSSTRVINLNRKEGVIKVQPFEIKDRETGETGLGIAEEELEGMEMLFGQHAMKYTIQCPGEIIFSDRSDATIDGNTIIIEDSFREIVKNNSIPGVIVKYKTK